MRYICIAFEKRYFAVEVLWENITSFSINKYFSKENIKCGCGEIGRHARLRI